MARIKYDNDSGSLYERGMDDGKKQSKERKTQKTYCGVVLSAIW
jgi:hypothetical protein